MRQGVLLSIVGLLAVIVLWRAWPAREEAPAPDFVGARLDGGGELTVLRLAGSPREKGRAHGTALRERIRAGLEALRPADPGMADFAIRTCGERLLPRIPDHLRQEIEGLAEGAGVSLHEAVFLNTRFELEAFNMVGSGESGPRFDLEAAVQREAGAVRVFRGTDFDAGEWVLVLHEDVDPPLALIALPGMVGGFLGVRGEAAATLRPMQTGPPPVLTGLSWPLLLRLLLETPARTGELLPARPSVHASVPSITPGGEVGVLNVSPDGGVWHPAAGPWATAREEPGAATGGVVSTGAPRDSVGPPEAGVGAFALRLVSTEGGVRVRLEHRDGGFERMVRSGG